MEREDHSDTHLHIHTYIENPLPVYYNEKCAMTECRVRLSEMENFILTVPQTFYKCDMTHGLPKSHHEAPVHQLLHTFDMF